MSVAEMSEHRLLIIFPNSLKPDQDQKDVRPDLDLKRMCMHSDSVPERIFEKVYFEKKSGQTTLKTWKLLTPCKESKRT